MFILMGGWSQWTEIERKGRTIVFIQLLTNFHGKFGLFSCSRFSLVFVITSYISLLFFNFLIFAPFFLSLPLRPEAAGLETSNQGTLTERERRLSSTFGLLVEVSWFVAHVNHIFNSKSY